MRTLFIALATVLFLVGCAKSVPPPYVCRAVAENLILCAPVERQDTSKQ
jgi:hypothetical protein